MAAPVPVCYDGPVRLRRTWFRPRRRTVDALLLLVAASAAAYDPPYPGLSDAIRAYTQPDILRVVVHVYEECDVNTAEVDGLIEAEMIRRRIERTHDRAAALGALWVSAECLITSDDQYVFSVDAELAVHVLDPLGRPGRGSTMAVLIAGSIGITPSVDDIRDTMVGAAERALTDIIYAHSNDPDE